MSFYDLLCEHYDDIFPAGRDDLRFVNSLIEDKRILLDLGCGTGNKTELLAGNGRQIVGIDADPAMIDYATKHHSGGNISYLVLDLRNMERQLTPDSFDAVVCLGNTIPHLTGQGVLYTVLMNIRAIMRKDGYFIGQMLNYERIIEQNITELPVVETEKVVFRRTYEWRDGTMYFKGELRDKRTGTVQSNTTQLRPTLKGELEGLLYEAGFTYAEFFGGLDGQPYVEQSSYHMVFRARQWAAK